MSVEKRYKVNMRGICINPLRKPNGDEFGNDSHELEIKYRCQSIRRLLLHLRKTKNLPLYDNKSVEIIRCQVSSEIRDALVLFCRCDDWPYVYKVILIRLIENEFVYEIINNSREKDEELAIKCYNNNGGDFYAPLEESEIDVTNCIF